MYCIKCFQMAARRPNLRPFRSITRTLQVSDDEDSAEESYSEEDEDFVDFVVSVEDTTEETSAEEGDGEEADATAEVEEDDDFNDEAEPANKKKRVMDAVVRQRSRGRPRKSIPASKGPMTWTENVPTQITRRSLDMSSFSAAPQNDATTITSPLEGFKVLFTDEMINLIVLHTNVRIDISVHELKAKNHVNRIIRLRIKLKLKRTLA